MSVGRGIVRSFQEDSALWFLGSLHGIKWLGSSFEKSGNNKVSASFGKIDGAR